MLIKILLFIFSFGCLSFAFFFRDLILTGFDIFCYRDSRYTLFDKKTI